jgi:hypothetical protein
VKFLIVRWESDVPGSAAAGHLLVMCFLNSERQSPSGFQQENCIRTLRLAARRDVFHRSVRPHDDDTARGR